MQLVFELYKVTSKFPPEERYGLYSQMRRSAISIPSNIAEGYGRYNRKEFSQFLRVARGSIFELETQIELSGSLGFINQSEYKDLLNSITDINRMLTAFINQLNY